MPAFRPYCRKKQGGASLRPLAPQYLITPNKMKKPIELVF